MCPVMLRGARQREAVALLADAPRFASEVANELDIDLSQTCRMLDDLREKGVVEREESEGRPCRGNPGGRWRVRQDVDAEASSGTSTWAAATVSLAVAATAAQALASRADLRWLVLGTSDSRATVVVADDVAQRAADRLVEIGISPDRSGVYGAGSALVAVLAAAGTGG